MPFAFAYCQSCKLLWIAVKIIYWHPHTITSALSRSRAAPILREIPLRFSSSLIFCNSCSCSKCVTAENSTPTLSPSLSSSSCVRLSVAFPLTDSACVCVATSRLISPYATSSLRLHEHARRCEFVRTCEWPRSELFCDYFLHECAGTNLLPRILKLIPQRAVTNASAGNVVQICSSKPDTYNVY